METKIIMVVLRQKWTASTWSDIQTFTFMTAPFAVNTLYLGNNGWLNFCLTMCVLLWLFAKVVASSKKTKRLNQLQTDSIDEAIEFLNEQRKQA